MISYKLTFCIFLQHVSGSHISPDISQVSWVCFCFSVFVCLFFVFLPVRVFMFVVAPTFLFHMSLICRVCLCVFVFVVTCTFLKYLECVCGGGGEMLHEICHALLWKCLGPWLLICFYYPVNIYNVGGLRCPAIIVLRRQIKKSSILLFNIWKLNTWTFFKREKSFRTNTIFLIEN